MLPSKGASFLGMLKFARLGASKVLPAQHRQRQAKNVEKFASNL
jgi:hypothetical protein